MDARQAFPQAPPSKDRPLGGALRGQGSKVNRKHLVRSDRRPSIRAMADATMPSIGDVLMLSQVAWRTGRAFTSGRASAPREFLQIESELNGVAKSLKLLAETLLLDGSEQLIQQAEANIQNGLATILLSCKRTLEDLESLVDQYQVIKKNRTSGGYTVERSWSELVNQNYSSMMWTTEGGNIQDLRELLHVHTASISLTKNALQSNDLDRFNYTVAPISEGFEQLYNRFGGSVHDKLQDLRHVINAVAGRHPAISPSILPTVKSVDSGLSQLSIQPSRSNNASSYAEERVRCPAPLVTPTRTPEMIARELSRSPTQVSPSIRRTPPLQRGLGLEASDDRTTASPTPSLTPPQQQPRPSSAPRRTTSGKNEPSLAPTSEEPEEPHPGHRRSASDSEFTNLPPSAWSDDEDGIRPAKLKRRERSKEISLTPDVESTPVKLERATSTASQQDAFEKMLFKNSAILCDLRGKLVEFTQPAKDEDRPWDLDIEQAMEDCRICLVRRRDILHNGSTRFTTNIWAFSDDLAVRMQHSLPDDAELIPYSSYFDPCKVSITIPSQLVFHAVSYSEPPLRTATSEWINYIFSSPSDANSFQNQLFGRTLIASYKTEKTLRVHEGVGKVIKFDEQMCAMETLRLWEEEESGGVLGMIHFSAQFRRGYMLFYLNSQDNRARVRDEGGKVVKIKGLRIPLEPEKKMERSQSLKEGQGRRKSDSTKIIAGAKVEFASENEKIEFLGMVAQVQRRMIEGLQEIKC